MAGSGQSKAPSEQHAESPARTSRSFVIDTTPVANLSFRRTQRGLALTQIAATRQWTRPSAILTAGSLRATWLGFYQAAIDLGWRWRWNWSGRRLWSRRANDSQPAASSPRSHCSRKSQACQQCCIPRTHRDSTCAPRRKCLFRARGLDRSKGTLELIRIRIRPDIGPDQTEKLDMPTNHRHSKLLLDHRCS